MGLSVPLRSISFRVHIVYAIHAPRPCSLDKLSSEWDIPIEIEWEVLLQMSTERSEPFARLQHILQPLESPHHPKPKGGQKRNTLPHKKHKLSKAAPSYSCYSIAKQPPIGNCYLPRKRRPPPTTMYPLLRRINPEFYPLQSITYDSCVQYCEAPMHHQLQKKSTTPLSHCEAHPTV